MQLIAYIILGAVTLVRGNSSVPSQNTLEFVIPEKLEQRKKLKEMNSP